MVEKLHELRLKRRITLPEKNYTHYAAATSSNLTRAKLQSWDKKNLEKKELLGNAEGVLYDLNKL